MRTAAGRHPGRAARTLTCSTREMRSKPRAGGCAIDRSHRLSAHAAASALAACWACPAVPLRPFPAGRTPQIRSELSRLYPRRPSRRAGLTGPHSARSRRTQRRLPVGKQSLPRRAAAVGGGGTGGRAGAACPGGQAPRGGSQRGGPERLKKPSCRRGRASGGAQGAGT